MLVLVLLILLVLLFFLLLLLLSSSSSWSPISWWYVLLLLRTLRFILLILFLNFILRSKSVVGVFMWRCKVCTHQRLANHSRCANRNSFQNIWPAEKGGSLRVLLEVRLDKIVTLRCKNCWNFIRVKTIETLPVQITIVPCPPGGCHLIKTSNRCDWT